jgi:hypothetical protein
MVEQFERLQSQTRTQRQKDIWRKIINLLPSFLLCIKVDSREEKKQQKKTMDRENYYIS